ncbi:ABC transporter permease [Siccirubricoccus deserti]|uniref:ABC transporter substrate-binding protein n=1 Tax=Siccirubricoccus deserti TaxID=2013562 RepID=A0A9X0QXW7_9PROT|nr:ABC transporter substrate-binding protein [Siccirubricoccus deserti]MBC4016006.1 ABC transporter substrate-binding protein [Siccirubricoccus deserti]GGC39914.1 ABC transporter permease [Siccirubricoccus deserti]
MTALADRATRRSLLTATAAAPLATAVAPRCARGQRPTIRIGVLTDVSGPYSDNTGQGSAVAARLAIEDFTRDNPGIRAEVQIIDFQNRAEVGLNAARGWYDREDVDVILDVPNSAIALAVANLAREKNKVAIFTGAASSDLTGRACGPNHLHWVYDTWSQAHATATALVAEGGDSWFFITADYAFGHSTERDAATFVRAAGGKVLGAARYPFPATTDFSAQIVQARASGAKVLGLANGGADIANCVKQAAEFGLQRSGVRIAAILILLPEVHSIGLNAAQGLVATDTFYWDQDDGSRAFARRFQPLYRGIMPTHIHAGGYSATLHYLKAAASMGVAAAKADGAAAIRRMKEMPTDDPLFGRGMVRADGRKIHPAYLYQVKAPAESRGPWDYYRRLRTIPADQAFRPLSEGGCAMVQS